MVAVLVSCPMHVSVMALGVAVSDADRLARAALAAEVIEFPTATGRVTTELTSIGTAHPRPGDRLILSLPDSANGLHRTIKLYPHQVADVDLPQLRIPDAAAALRLLSAAPAVV
ncbi:hypothetical protein F7Q99_36260 [Streptomyces kaniharaensis]|uniref:Uncharacterized protein n=1 Tax=Streptomyces kaniharaensis TaxID=212423 RepID=A0A6N7L3V6_9ACTN|nr:hypothetical protein [Streptomyces kaniharaensis]MQS17497.1 hypothetical protein [Streptomyces kaniharaensis]